MEIKMIQDKSADTDAAGWPTAVLRRILKELFTLFLLWDTSENPIGIQMINVLYQLKQGGKRWKKDFWLV